MKEGVSWKKTVALFIFILCVVSINHFWPTKEERKVSQLSNTDDYIYVETIKVEEEKYRELLLAGKINRIYWEEKSAEEIGITGYTKENKKFYFLTTNKELINLSKNQKVPVEMVRTVDNGKSLLLLISIFGAFFTFIYLIPRRKPEVALSSKESTYEFKEEDSSTKFEDIAGAEEIKEELMEIVEFLKDPEPFEKLGAKIPKGVILYGPPGTGKTMLARAIASDAKASFFATSGSAFVEKYVGVGASRIRDIFANAKKKAPSIIFIDEIDAVGKNRNEEGNSERDQTLNQLLTEMDGFNSKETVIVIAATNRLDILDSALLRPGRFDRHVYVGPPDLSARQAILEVHTKNKPLDHSVDLGLLARKTHGLTGAYLANLTNEAAILAARKKKTAISIDEFDSALERVIAGLEKKNTVLNDRDKRVVSYHEAGHALLGFYLNTDRVEKISIIPRGQALGYVLQLPTEDKFITTKEELLKKITVFLGGRAAEDLVFGDISTGAQNDLERVTQLAYDIVCKYGMSKKIGLRTIDLRWNQASNLLVDDEIKNLIEECYSDAKKILTENMNKVEKIAKVLIEEETINGSRLEEILA